MVCGCPVTFESEELSELREDSRFELHSLICDDGDGNNKGRIHSRQGISTHDCPFMPFNGIASGHDVNQAKIVRQYL